ncbi:MAG: TonB-dependent receptor [Pseudomonadota bacterium]
MYKKQTLSLFATVSALALAFGSLQTEAQEAGIGGETVLDRIVVEGDKAGRTEDEIAPSIVLITEEDLQNPAKATIFDTINDIPNVIAEEDGNVPTVRGISSSVNTNQVIATGVLPRVPVLVDNVATTVAQSNGLLSNSAWDVGVVEVAKGPQPTSTGRNAFSGAIRIFTNDPVFDNEYAWRIGASSLRDEYNAAFMINQQLIEDELAIRIAGEIRDADTLVVVNDPRITAFDPNELRYENIRGKVRYAPAEIAGLDLQFTYDRNESRDQFAPVVDQGNAADQFSLNNYLGFGANDFSTRERYIGEGSYEFSDNYELFFRASRSDSEIINPFPGTTFLEALPFAPPFRDFGELVITSQETEFETYLQFSDLGVISKGVFGIIHNETDDLVDNDGSQIPVGDPVFGIIGFTPLGMPIFGNILTPPPFLIDVTGEATNTGIYGEVELDLGEISDFDGVTLIAGGRYEMDERSRMVFADTFLQSSRTFEENIFLPKVGVRYNPNDDFEIGYTYSESFRPGGVEVDLVSGFFVQVGAPATFQIAEFEKETIQNHEIHAKASLMDDQLQLGATAFYYIYEDAQVSGAGPQSTFVSPFGAPPFFLTGNVPEATGMGVELTAEYTNDAGLTLTGSVGWLETEITNSGPGANIAQFQGSELPNAPAFSASFGAHFQYDNGWDIGANIQFVDETISFLGGPTVGAYTLVDLSAGYNFEGFDGSDMRLDLSINNVFDTEHFIENTGAANVIGRPREGIITLTSRF